MLETNHKTLRTPQKNSWSMVPSEPWGLIHQHHRISPVGRHAPWVLSGWRFLVDFGEKTGFLVEFLGEKGFVGGKKWFLLLEWGFHSVRYKVGFLWAEYLFLSVRFASEILVGCSYYFLCWFGCFVWCLLERNPGVVSFLNLVFCSCWGGWFGCFLVCLHFY